MSIICSSQRSTRRQVISGSDFAKGVTVKTKLNGKTYENGTVTSVYGAMGQDEEGNPLTLFRIDTGITEEDFQALEEGKIYAAELKFYNAEGKLTFVGLMDVRNGGFTAATETEPSTAEAADAPAVDLDGTTATTYGDLMTVFAERIANKDTRREARSA